MTVPENPLSIPQQFRTQAEWARRLGSPLYDHLHSRAAEDYETGGPVRDLLQPYAPTAHGFALPLQVMAAVHRLVLEGRAPALASFYPSAGGLLDIEATWEPFRRTLAEQAEALRPLLSRPVQTNDPARSGSLLGGFLVAARHTGLPLRLLEIGSSAGLNLCWDRFRYEWSGGAWGDAASPLRLRNVFVEGAPPEASVTVAERSGCDTGPVDIRAPEGRLTLVASIWADQPERVRQLDAAIAIARGISYTVDRAGAADWLESRLAQPAAGAVTVVFHSVVWPYLSEAERARITQTIERAGAAASADAPVAWLRLEPAADSANRDAEVRLRIYPGYEERSIATSTFHTAAVRWHDGA